MHIHSIVKYMLDVNFWVKIENAQNINNTEAMDILLGERQSAITMEGNRMRDLCSHAPKQKRCRYNVVTSSEEP